MAWISSLVSPGAHQAPMDHTIESISPTPSVQASQHRQPPPILTPLALPNFRCVTDLVVSDVLDLFLLSTGTLVPSSPGAFDSLMTSCHAPLFSSSESESKQEDVVSHHSSHLPYGAQFHCGPPSYHPPDPQAPWFGQPWVTGSFPTLMDLLGFLAGSKTTGSP